MLNSKKLNLFEPSSLKQPLHACERVVRFLAFAVRSFCQPREIQRCEENSWRRPPRRTATAAARGESGRHDAEPLWRVRVCTHSARPHSLGTSAKA